MEQYYQLLSLLTSPSSRFFSTWDEYAALLLSLFPVDTAKASFFLSERPTYKQEVNKELAQINIVSQANDINLTTDFHSPDIEHHSLAYHRIKGMILSESNYYFSTRQFEQDLLAADSNSNIIAHFLHIQSGGGEAWYLDALSQTMTGLSKPIYTFVQKLYASAALYIGVHGQVIKAMTQNDMIGSLGTMISYLDILPYLEKLGVKNVEEYATRSDLKNKKGRDLRNGKPEQFIKEELDPLQQQFEAVVRAKRPKINSLDKDDPVFRGETFSAIESIDKHLIDGITSLPEALVEAKALGMQRLNNQRALSHLNTY